MVGFNQAAQRSYQKYLDSNDPDERIALYDKSNSQEMISSVMAVTAIGIWTVDMVWTVVGTRSLSKKSRKNNSITIGPGYDAGTGVPLLSMSVAF